MPHSIPKEAWPYRTSAAHDLLSRSLPPGFLFPLRTRHFAKAYHGVNATKVLESFGDDVHTVVFFGDIRWYHQNLKTQHVLSNPRKFEYVFFLKPRTVGTKSFWLDNKSNSKLVQNPNTGKSPLGPPNFWDRFWPKTRCVFWGGLVDIEHEEVHVFVSGNKKGTQLPIGVFAQHCKQTQRICMQICVQMWFRVLCEWGLSFDRGAYVVAKDPGFVALISCFLQLVDGPGVQRHFSALFCQLHCNPGAYTWTRTCDKRMRE